MIRYDTTIIDSTYGNDTTRQSLISMAIYATSFEDHATYGAESATGAERMCIY